MEAERRAGPRPLDPSLRPDSVQLVDAMRDCAECERTYGHLFDALGKLNQYNSTLVTLLTFETNSKMKSDSANS